MKMLHLDIEPEQIPFGNDKQKSKGNNKTPRDSRNTVLALNWADSEQFCDQRRDW
jgi:hypothetical protein